MNSDKILEDALRLAQKLLSKHTFRKSSSQWWETPTFCSTIFTKTNNFSDFLFASLNDKDHPKNLLPEQILFFSWSPLTRKRNMK